MVNNNRKFNVGIRNAGDSTLELHFLDAIYDTFDWSTWELKNMVEDVIQQVKNAKPSKIKVTIDSGGGDATIGLAIYNFLKSYDAKVEVEVIGLAGSIASVIAMAANKNKLFMARNAFMMIHPASGGTWGTSEEIRQYADLVDKFTDQIIDVYVQRTGKTAEAIKDLMANGDFWMTGSEAKELGFCDALINDNPNFSVAARLQNSSFKNIPKHLLEAHTKVEPEGNNFQTFLKDEIMNIKNLVTGFINSVTKPEKKEGEKDPVTPSAETVSLANSLEQPLTDFLTSLEKEVTADIAKAVENALPNIQAFKDMSSQIEALKKENEELKKEITDLVGGESTGGKKGEPANDAVGSFH